MNRSSGKTIGAVFLGFALAKLWDRVFRGFGVDTSLKAIGFAS